MKCLSLRQPYAELVVTGKKTIEIRTWNTKFRGVFLIHASKKIDREACKRNKIDPSHLVTGAILGKANLYDVKFYDNKNSFLRDRNKHLAEIKYADHKYGFLINHARKFRSPLYTLGKLGFFDVQFEGG
jgi:ASC-1-like (ASCH) protein